jgi:AcrR family transcriptional regulator
MGALRTPRERWVEAGLQALAAGGVERVRIETLAKTLGVTKGGFYGYFANRDALLQEMLDTWERQTVKDVIDRVAREHHDLIDQVRLAGQLTFTDHGLPVDLAIRNWARHDKHVAKRLRRVDSRRMQLLRDAIGAVGGDPDDVEARCLLAFSLAIGRHLLAAEHPGHTREQVVARAADLILER